MDLEYTTFQTSKILGIKYGRLREWIDRGDIIPSVSKADGQGTKTIFSRTDLYLIGLFAYLIDRKIFTRKEAAERVGQVLQYKKMTQAEVQNLIEVSTKKILNEHLSWRQYVDFCIEEYKLSETQSNKYWIRVWESIRERFSLDRDKLVDKHILKYWHLHDEAVKNKDLNTARQVLNDIAKLMGLNEPDRVDLKTSGEIIFKFGDE